MSSRLKFKAGHSSRQNQSVVVSIIGNEGYRSLCVIETVCLDVVGTSGIPFLLWLQAVFLVPFLECCQSVVADAINIQ